MKFIAILFCFFFMASVSAESPNFKVLSHEEYKKLPKPQQIEYLKEFAKRMGTPSKRKPARTSFNVQPSKLQMILADVLGLPMAMAADDNEAEALQNQWKKSSTAPPVDLNERARLEGLRQKVQGETEENDRRINELKSRLTEMQRKLSLNTKDIESTNKSIETLEDQNKVLNESPDSAGSRAIHENIEKIERLQSRLLLLKENDSKIAKDASNLSTAVIDLNLKNGVAPQSLQEIQAKIKVMDEQIQKRDIALREQAKLSEKINKDEKNIATIKSNLEKIEAQSARAENELLATDDPELKQELRREIEINAASIAAAKKKIEALSTDRDVKANQKDNLAKMAPTPKDPNIKTVTSSGTVLTDTQAKNVNTACSRPNLSVEQEASCAQALGKIPQGNGKVTGGANGKVGGGANGPAKVTGSANGPTGKPGETAKPGDDDKSKAAPMSIEKATDLCPHAGFVMMLDETNKDVPCPAISDAGDNRYVGKITKGPGAKASCKENKDYSVEASILCQPYIFGLTANDNGVCVAPGQDVTKRCYAEASNKKTFDKAWQVVSENEEGFRQWITGLKQMCEDKLTSNPNRQADTKETCAHIALAQKDLEEAKKRAKGGTPPTPPAKPATAIP